MKFFKFIALTFIFFQINIAQSLELELSYYENEEYEYILLPDKIGYVKFCKQAKDVYWISHVFIHRNYRGNNNKLGTYLLKNTMHFIIDTYKITAIRLRVYPFDEEDEEKIEYMKKRLIEWYKSLGFQEDEIPGYMVYYVKPQIISKL